MISTADLLDENPELECMTDHFYQYGGLEAFAGEVRTVVCPDDNVLLRQLVEEPGHGGVIVVDACGTLGHAAIGSRLAEIAMRNGWNGLVVNGAVRDVAALRRIKLGIKALGSNPRRNPKRGGGALDVPVAVGGVVVSPGDFLWSDADGVVLSPVS